MAGSNGHKRETVSTLREEKRQLVDTVELFSERLAELELSLEDVGWKGLSGEDDREFSTDGLRKIIQLCRLHYLKNPLINRAVEVTKYYIFAQGVSFSARHPDVNTVIQRFIDDRPNQAELFGHGARSLKEVELEIAANLFLVLFTEPTAGRVQLSSILVEEILAGDIITNPGNRKEVWFYKRVWTERATDLDTGGQTITPRTAYYPDWLYRPPAAERRQAIGGAPVLWDAPVMHVKVGGIEGMRFGVPEVYSAIDWARAVKQDLEDYATLRRALARFAWLLTSKGGPKAIAAAKAKLGTTIGTSGVEGNPPPAAGSTFIGSDPNQMQPIRTAGAAPTPEDSRRLWLMVSAGTGIPETIIAGNADQGNRATAQTLDRPTELKMMDRQTLWKEVFDNLLGYVIEQAVRAITPALGGRVVVDPLTGEESIELELAQVGGEDPGGTIDITFPDVLEHDPEQRVLSIVSAATLDGKTPANTIPPKALRRLLMSALKVEDVDEILEAMFPDDENAVEEYEPPPPPPDPLALAAAAAQAGGDQTAGALKVAKEALAQLAERRA